MNKISERICVSRPSLLKVLNYLEQAVLITQAKLSIFTICFYI